MAKFAACSKSVITKHGRCYLLGDGISIAALVVIVFGVLFVLSI
uniref:Uncharacterized protein n=1 Tax=Arundo donax TaxID=35708 RepID=A0A0A9AGP2_ARUDO